MEFIDILRTIGIFMGALMILVFIHELGHFLAAKLFGMRVERFSVGFPPRVWGFKKGDTDYCIGATPLGGYVKISGMVDESMDTEFMNKEPEPWEYRSKPVWQRMIVITAGVIFNMILAWFIFTGMTWVNGKVVVFAEQENGIYIDETSFLYDLGFRNNDQIIAVNGKNVDYFNDLVSPSEITSSNLFYTVIRNGESVDINIPPSFLDSIQTRGFLDLDYLLPSKVLQVVSDSPADIAGLESDDLIIEADGFEVNSWNGLVSSIESSTGPMDLLVLRGIDTLAISVTPDAAKKIGIQGGSINSLNYDLIEYGFLASVSEGYTQTIETTTGILNSFGLLLRGEVSVKQNLGGPIAIARETKRATDESGASGFWRITAFLSITLAIMNILPIPALDGGHLVFLIYEGIVRKEPSEKFKIVAQNIGFILLLTLMVFVIFNDIMKLF
ncbi:MAG: RIP metalloprotease RseP [Balneola sp.]|nr:MAG: RIP metalloprotease RseP [Balneola sp.]